MVYLLQGGDSMRDEEIAKDIVIAMIQQGFFDNCNDNHNQKTRTNERITLISHSFRELCKAIKNSEK